MTFAQRPGREARRRPPPGGSPSPRRRAARRILVLGVVAALLPACSRTYTVGRRDSYQSAPDAGAGCDQGANNWKTRTPAASGSNDAGTVRSNLFGIWGASASAIFAVGSAGKVLFYDGKAWTAQSTPTTETLTSVWGISATEVWAVGYHGTVLRFDGVKWQDRSPSMSAKINDGGISDASSGDGGAADASAREGGAADASPRDGGAADAEAGLPDSAVKARPHLRGIWVGGKKTTETLFAVGDQGTVLYFDGKTATWSMGTPILAKGQATKLKDQLNGVWGSPAGKVYVAGDFGTILVGTAAGLNKQNTGITKDLIGIWGRDDDDVYAVGISGTILHYRKERWSAVTGAPRQVLRGIWGPPGDASMAYAVGWDGTLLRIKGGPSFVDGASFASYPCVSPLRRLEGIWGAAAPGAGVDAGAKGSTSAWVVGASGMIITGP